MNQQAADIADVKAGVGQIIALLTARTGVEQ